MKITKLKAAALQYVVLLSLLIFLFIGFFMLRAFYANININEMILQDAAVDNLSSAEVVIKNNPEWTELSMQKTIDLFEDSISRVNLETFNWGVYKYVHMKTQIKQHIRKQIILIGDDVETENRPSLYLADKNRYLSVCGDTWLTGPVSIPALGVRKSYVDGIGYYKAKAVQGEIQKSDKDLPAIRPEFSEQFSALFEKQEKKDSLVLWDDMDQDVISNPFQNKSLSIWSNETIDLNDLSLSGNIKIISEKGIRIAGTTKINQALLIAPSVYVEKHFKGSVQIFAKDSIKIEENCQFYFPSVLFMSGENPEKTLEINQNTIFSGDIVVNGKSEKNMPHIILETDTKMEGLVYCDGSIELKGDIAGSIYTNKFVLHTRSAIYENHLLNNRIDCTDLNEHYVGVAWFKPSTRKQVIDYLQ